MDLNSAWKPTWSETLETLRVVHLKVNKQTTRFYYTSNEQSTKLDGRKPPVDEQRDLLNGLADQIAAHDLPSHSQRRAELRGGSRVSDSGDPQSPSDRYANKKMRRHLKKYLGDYIDGIAGEEYKDKHWRRVEGLSGGTRFMLVDDLDGSTNLEVQGSGYSTNGVLYARTKSGRNVPLASITVDDKGWALVVDRRTERVLHYDSRGAYTLLSGDEYLPRDAHVCLAVVARSGAKRARVASLFVSEGVGLGLPEKVHGGKTTTSPALDISTLGGAPAIMQYIAGGLGMVILIDRQTIWDASPLLAAPMLGRSRFYAIESDEEFSGQEVTAMFSTVARPNIGEPSLSKPIEAMLVVRRDVEEAYPHVVAEVLRRARDDYRNPKRLVAEPITPNLRTVGDK